METGVQSKRFSYADYEKAIREPFYDFLWETTRRNAAYFHGCRNVLDLASGQGFLLETLRDMEIDALGVDNEKHLVEGCRGRGLVVVEDDLFHFLATTGERFAGVSCNHIIEHMGYEPFIDLVEGVHRVLKPGGIFLLTWPNPRSAGTQFQNFWKDPTHSRFYDGDFVKAVLLFYGFGMVETFYDTTTPCKYEADTAVSSTPGPAEEERKIFVLGRAKNFIRRAVIKMLGLGSLVGEHEQNRRRLEIFEVPGDARIVARR